MSKRHRNLKLPDARVVLRSSYLDNPRDMKAKVTCIEGELRPIVIGSRGKHSMQVFAECGNPLPVPACNISDHIPPFQEETGDELAPESRRVMHGGRRNVIPWDKTLLIRRAFPNKVVVQNAQNGFFRSFELVLSPAEEQTIRTKSFFPSATELDSRIQSIFPPADFTVIQHDGSFRLTCFCR